MGQPDEALALQERAGRSRPRSAARASRALPLLVTALAGRPGAPHGRSLRSIGKYARRGARALQAAKRHLPYDPIYTKLADVYFQQGKLNEALAQLDELATHYENRCDLDRSIETLEYGEQLAPNNIPIVSRLAKLQIRRGYLDKGVDGLIRSAATTCSAKPAS